jgi:hypothetical protein
MAAKGRRRNGPTAKSSDMGSGDLDTTSTRRRVHEAVAVFDDPVEDWEYHQFGSSRVNAARYSQSRRQLIVDWANSPGGAPPYPAYVYDAVPPAVWTGFRTAGSAGNFVNTTLNTFPYRPTSQTV